MVGASKAAKRARLTYPEPLATTEVPGVSGTSALLLLERWALVLAVLLGVGVGVAGLVGPTAGPVVAGHL